MTSERKYLLCDCKDPSCTVKRFEDKLVESGMSDEAILSMKASMDALEDEKRSENPLGEDSRSSSITIASTTGALLTTIGRILTKSAEIHTGLSDKDFEDANLDSIMLSTQVLCSIVAVDRILHEFVSDAVVAPRSDKVKDALADLPDGVIPIAVKPDYLRRVPSVLFNLVCTLLETFKESVGRYHNDPMRKDFLELVSNFRDFVSAMAECSICCNHVVDVCREGVAASKACREDAKDAGDDVTRKVAPDGSTLH